jgi:hypothetical protein
MSQNLILLSNQLLHLWNEVNKALECGSHALIVSPLSDDCSVMATGPLFNVWENRLWFFNMTQLPRLILHCIYQSKSKFCVIGIQRRSQLKCNYSCMILLQKGISHTFYTSMLCHRWIQFYHYVYIKDNFCITLELNIRRLPINV